LFVTQPRSAALGREDSHPSSVLNARAMEKRLIDCDGGSVA
jgi:hypothetical protein